MAHLKQNNYKEIYRHNPDAPSIDAMMREVLHRLGNIDFEYEIAVDKLEQSAADAATTIHVGDLYQVDVVGARAAGLRGVLLDEKGLYEGVDCPRVRSLTELVTRIGIGEFD